MRNALVATVSAVALILVVLPFLPSGHQRGSQTSSATRTALQPAPAVLVPAGTLPRGLRGKVPAGAKVQQIVASSVDEAAYHFRSQSRISNKVLRKAMARAKAKGWRPTTFLATASSPRYTHRREMQRGITLASYSDDLVIDDVDLIIWEWEDDDLNTLDELVWMRTDEPFDQATFLAQFGGEGQMISDLSVAWSELEDYQVDEGYWQEYRGYIQPWSPVSGASGARRDQPTLQFCSANSLRGCCVPYFQFVDAYVQAALSYGANELAQTTKEAIKAGLIQAGIGSAITRSVRLRSVVAGVLANILYAWYDEPVTPFDYQTWLENYIRYVQRCDGQFIISIYCFP